jgi:hypothetical protein
MNQPPREITAAVSRRAWADPKVRLWWLIALAMLGIALVLATMSYRDWARLARTIESGVTVPAHIDGAAGDPRKDRAVAATDVVGITYEYKGARFQNVLGVLGSRNPPYRVGETITIHIDPNDPGNWTVRSTYPTLALAMIGPILVLPVAVICGLIALAGRRAVLKTYRDGQPVEAIVSTNRQTPLAPGSRAIQCSLTSGSRMMEVFVPGALSQLKENDAVAVLIPPGRGRPLAVAWFHAPGE